MTAQPDRLTRIIRLADRGDQAGLVELTLRAWAPVFASLRVAMDPRLYRIFYPDWRTAQVRAIESVLGDPTMRCWVMVAEQGTERLIGFVAARLHLSTRMGEIHLIGVDPVHQRVGIARELCSVAEQWMKDAGMQVVMVETGGDPGHAPARAVYERMGFTAMPAVRYFKPIGPAGDEGI